MQVAIGNTNLTLTIHSGKTVNGISTGYAIANVFILGATLAANSWAIRVILRKEKIRINKLIIWDCFVNMVTMALLTHNWKKALHNFYQTQIYLGSDLWVRISLCDLWWQVMQVYAGYKSYTRYTLYKL